MYKWSRNTWFSIYSVFMWSMYFTYIYLNNYRLTSGIVLMHQDNLTINDLEYRVILGNWSNYLELTFLGMFIVVLIICLTKKEQNLLYTYAIFNSALIAGMATVSYILNFILFLPIGNLLELLIFPNYLMLAYFIHIFIYFEQNQKWNGRQSPH